MALMRVQCGMPRHLKCYKSHKRGVFLMANVILNWAYPTALATPPIKHKIYRRLASDVVYGIAIAEVLWPGSSYTDIGVADGSYVYGVRAVNASGEGPAKEQSITVSGLPIAPPILTVSVVY